jgi:integrase
LPWKDAPAFIAELRMRQALAAKCLEFLILTAARSGEVLGATWGEIDLTKELWTIPAARMKAGPEHVVPLSDAAVQLLEELVQRPHTNGSGVRHQGSCAIKHGNDHVAAPDGKTRHHRPRVLGLRQLSALRHCRL